MTLKREDRLTNRVVLVILVIAYSLIILLVNDLETLIGGRDDQRHEHPPTPYMCGCTVNLRISILGTAALRFGAYHNVW